MKIISVNSGSSSVKMQVYKMPEKKVLAKFGFEKINFDNSFGSCTIGGEKTNIELNNKATYTQCISKAIDILVEKQIISNINDVAGVGHRVVMGADEFEDSTLVNEHVTSKIVELAVLAPLHNCPNYEGIKAFQTLDKNLKQVACFDTAFHQSMPKSSYTFPIKQEIANEYKIRRYGAHGMSVKYIVCKYAKLKNKNVNDVNIIVAHIGSGASITAIKNGKTYETSMGFSPLGGIIMGTRTGDMDPSVVLKLIEIYNGDYEKVSKILNSESGILGISNLSNDMRDIEKNRTQNEDAQLAYDMFIKRIVDFIGSYAIKFDNLDAIVLTAGIGENSVSVQEDLKNYVKNIGVNPCSKSENEFCGDVKYLSKPETSVEFLVIPTDEELMIAEDTYNIINKELENEHK